MALTGPSRSTAGPTPGSRSVAQRVSKAVAAALLTAAWAGVCFIQVGLVASRLFSTPEALAWNHIAGAVLVYLPIGLAAAAVWLTRTRPLGFAVVVHIGAMWLSLLFWAM